MIYHENPVGPSLAGLEAVREVLAHGPGCAARYLDNDPADLVAAILAYNRKLHPAARRLTAHNAMLLVGSSDGLMLIADTFVAGGTLVGEWPAYRIIRERVWQQGGTVVDVPFSPRVTVPPAVTAAEPLATSTAAPCVPEGHEIFVILGGVTATVGVSAVAVTFSVTAEDQYNNVVTTFHDVVKASIGTNVGGAIGAGTALPSYTDSTLRLKLMSIGCRPLRTVRDLVDDPRLEQVDLQPSGEHTSHGGAPRSELAANRDDRHVGSNLLHQVVE